MENKINKLKKFLQENYPNMQAFNTRNIAGDYMKNVYDKDNIQVNYAPKYDYIEIFGLSDKEFDSLLDREGHLKNFSEYKKQNKIDLQVGDRVTYKYLNNNDNKIYTSIIEDIGDLENYKRMIESKIEISSIKILKVERPKYEVVEEKKELLTKEEKEFLRQYIKIIKSLNNGTVDKIRRKEEDIYVVLKNGLTYKIEIGMQFGNMNVEYTLEELGLD